MPHPRSAASAALTLTGLLLLGACGGTAPAPAAAVHPLPAAVVVAPQLVEETPGASAEAPPVAQERASRDGGGRRPVTVERAPDARRGSAQQRGEAALAALRFPWQELAYAVHFAPYTGGTLGLASARTRTITVFVKPGQDEGELRTTIAHELGHALDHVHGTSARREEYRRLRGLSPHTSWYPCDRCSDFASPAGDFAEVFAAALVGTGDFRSRLAPAPTADELRRLAPLLSLPVEAPAASRPASPPAPAPSPSPTRDSLLPLLG